ncbi:hypothetical protein LXL04_007813 [Taraxacum kok-saghyz]
MERNTPVRKPHTSAVRSSARSHQPSDGISKVVFAGQVTDEEVESLNKSFFAANAHVDEEPVAVGNEEPEAVADDANDHVYEEQVYDEHMVTTNGSGGFVANKR